MAAVELTGQRELLRLATAGSVDDGKSTLIGRLLLDTGSLLADHLDDVSRGGALDLAAVTDGLRAEREQGITIDVAYRFFSTARRSFILADTPGHERYTRNMFTGASTADVALVLIDARTGVVTQTRRHAHIAALLGIEHIVMCVNKMDLVSWDRERFAEIVDQVHDVVRRLGVPDLTVIPISALHGDNVAVALRPHAVLRRPDAARVSGGGRHPGRPRPVAPATPDPMGGPAGGRRAHGSTWGGSTPARSRSGTRWSCCPPASRRRSPSSTRSTATRKRRCRRCRSRSRSPTGSTSAAATCWWRPGDQPVERPRARLHALLDERGAAASRPALRPQAHHPHRPRHRAGDHRADRPARRSSASSSRRRWPSTTSAEVTLRTSSAGGRRPVLGQPR